MSKPVIVFSGYNQRAVIALLRTLESSRVKYGIIATPNSDPIFYSAYSDKAIKRQQQQLVLDDIVDSIKAMIRKLGPASTYLIAPSTEALNRFLLNNRREIESLGCELPLVEAELYATISDKESFTQLCIQESIKVPSEYDLDSITVPCVAKPRIYKQNTERPHVPVLISNHAELELFKQQYSIADFYYQQFIGGESYYLLYYFHENGKIDKLSQQNLVQQPEGKSIVAATTSDKHTQSISAEYENMLSKRKFRGLIMIEVKLWNGDYYMIEANPRMWGPSQLFIDAGTNLFESLLYDYGVIGSISMTKNENVKRYFWHGGIAPYEKSLEILAYHAYDKDTFIKEMPLWLAEDIYNREDTKRIYQYELEA